MSDYEWDLKVEVIEPIGKRRMKKHTENNFRLSDEKLKNVVTFGMILLTEYIINVVSLLLYIVN
ncbi:MAG TPA: hypothetical protein VF222_12620 [Nitrososphaeraceae archaeon]